MPLGHGSLFLNSYGFGSFLFLFLQIFLASCKDFSDIIIIVFVYDGDYIELTFHMVNG